MGNIKETFLRRKEFDDKNDLFDPPKSGSVYTKYYLDSWYTSPFYGKVDTLGIPIIPKPGLLRHCTYSKDKIQVRTIQPALDFIFPLRQQYKEYYALGSMSRNSKYLAKDIPPLKGYINGSLEFVELLKNLYQRFFQYLKSSNKANSVKSFNDFANELISFIKNNREYFTRAGYVESSDFSLLHTGLGIEIYNEKTINEDERIGFFEDPNHEPFLELCIRNNLKIDREIPWRVYVDIRTKPVNYGETSKNQLDFETVVANFIPGILSKNGPEEKLQLFFDTYYDRVIPYDMDSYSYLTEFITTIKSFYSAFIASTSSYKSFLINPCGTANVQNIHRETTTPVGMEEYIKLYLLFRSAELVGTVEEETLERAREISVEIFKTDQNSNPIKAAIAAIKYFTDSAGTLTYRNQITSEFDNK